MKLLFNTAVLLLSFNFLIACGKNDPDSDKTPSAKGDHTYIFTINGHEFSNDTFTATIKNSEAFAVFTPTPVSGHMGIMFSASNEKTSCIAHFIRKDNKLLQLGMDIDETSNFNHSIISFIFTHNGETYTLQSLSGTCTEKSFQLHSSGSMAAINATFSGIFSGGPSGTNEPQEYHVTGEVDVKFNGE